MPTEAEQEKWTADMMQAYADALHETIPDGFLFALLVFPSSNAGIGNYVSNATRSDMITCLRETADRLERNQDKPRYPFPPENDDG